MSEIKQRRSNCHRCKALDWASRQCELGYRTRSDWIALGYGYTSTKPAEPCPKPLTTSALVRHLKNRTEASPDPE